jgi:cytochrome c peroxidase
MNAGAMTLPLAAVLAAALQLPAAPARAGGGEESWTTAERAVLATLHISRLPAARPDPSNAVERSPAAAALGKRLFFDTRLSKNQKVACASCHVPDQQFQDGLAVGQGVGTGIRRTMPIGDNGGQTWFFWDGRKDSLWSQALGPLEDPAEHGGNRLAYAKLLERHYRGEYEAVFRTMPALAGLPDNAGPSGTPDDARHGTT